MTTGATTTSVPAGCLVRTGRPPCERAGEVEERILDAATQVFLERGFDGASIDRIAEVAHAGKPSIYTRFLGKEPLFVAMVDRWARRSALLESTATGATLEARLSALAVDILRQVLAPESVGMLRMIIAEARRFPDLATQFNRKVRAQGTATVARLVGGLADTDEARRLPAFAEERLAITARLFLDLVMMPMLVPMLFGETLAGLQIDVETHAARAVAFLMATWRREAEAAEPS